MKMGLEDSPMQKQPMPALFIGHGNPMNAITENPFRKSWEALGRDLPKPRVVLCVSAHWETHKPMVCAANLPKTIHDFSGFPAELFAVNYPAPGSPAFAQEIVECSDAEVAFDNSWGLDHGAWQVLMHLFPEADVPIVQLSISRTYSAEQHVALARKFTALRDTGVMILGSGNIVHNLRMLSLGAAPDWARAFDKAVGDAIREDNFSAVIDYHNMPGSSMAVPTPEHFWPLLYVMAVRRPDDTLKFFNETFDAGSISMRSLILS